jgi:hypothetical protein
VGPRAGLETEVRGKILCPCRGSNPDRQAKEGSRKETAKLNGATLRTVYRNMLKLFALCLQQVGRHFSIHVAVV